jgi:hypothetical protein
MRSIDHFTDVWMVGEHHRRHAWRGARSCQFGSLLAVVAGLCLMIAAPSGGQSASPGGEEKDKGYTIEKPGTITFTVGIKIKGKVEKPQVVIFLPKEKPVYRQVVLTHSFANELVQPLPFKPVLE